MRINRKLLNLENKISNSIFFSTKKKKASLHEPIFFNREKKYLTECIKTTFVSTSGFFISKFENKIKEFTKIKDAIAVITGTSALEICIRVLGAKKNDEILIPTLTFVGTANAVVHAGCTPHFIDSDLNTLGIDVDKLEDYLNRISKIKNNKLFNKITKKRIFGIIPVHVFGHMTNMEKLIKIAKKFKLKIIEDAAEALGSYYKNKHAGTFGDLGVISFNGNKTITSGGGGVILSKNKNITSQIRHLISTSKLKHKWKFLHDKVGWNFRMTNLSAAVGLAQIENIKKILFFKKKITNRYINFYKKENEIKFFQQPKNCKSNYWLNTILVENISLKERNKLLEILNNKKYECRPVWKLMHRLPMFQNCPKSNLNNSKKLESELICLPSSPKYGK